MLGAYWRLRNSRQLVPGTIRVYTWAGSSLQIVKQDPPADAKEHWETEPERRRLTEASLCFTSMSEGASLAKRWAIYIYYIRRAMSWAIGVEGTIGVDLRLEVPQCARAWASCRNLFMTRLGVSYPTVYITQPVSAYIYI